MSRVGGIRKRTLHIGLAIVAVLLIFGGVVYATQPVNVGNGQPANCSNPQYAVTVTASLFWTQGLLGDSVSAQSKQASVTVQCPQAFSVSAGSFLGLFNLYSQTGKFQTIGSLTASGQQVGAAWTGSPTLTAGQASTATVYTGTLAQGSYLLNVQINEQGCYQFPYLCGGWPFPSTTFSQVGSFTCGFVLTLQTVSGSVQNC